MNSPWNDLSLLDGNEVSLSGALFTEFVSLSLSVLHNKKKIYSLNCIDLYLFLYVMVIQDL